MQPVRASGGKGAGGILVHSRVQQARAGTRQQSRARQYTPGAGGGEHRESNCENGSASLKYRAETECPCDRSTAEAKSRVAAHCRH